MTSKWVNVFRRFQQLLRDTESVTSTIVNAGECTDGSQKIVGAEVPCDIRHTANLIRRVIRFILPRRISESDVSVCPCIVVYA